MGFSSAVFYFQLLMASTEEDDSTEYLLPRQSVRKEPNYTLIPIVRTPNVDPGETIEIDLFFSGAGNPHENKLSVYHSHPNLVDHDNPGYLSVSVGWTEERNLLVGNEALGSEELETRKHMSEYGFIAQMSNSHFVKENIVYGEKGPDFDYPVKISESVNDGIAPLRYRLHTDSQAKSGDYDITFVFTYGEEAIGDKMRVNQDRQDVCIHLNNKREQWEPVPTIAGISVALLALASLVYSTGFASLIYKFITGLLAV